MFDIWPCLFYESSSQRRAYITFAEIVTVADVKRLQQFRSSERRVF